MNRISIRYLWKNYIPKPCEICHKNKSTHVWKVGYFFNTSPSMPMIICHECMSGKKEKIEAIYSLGLL